MQQLGFKEAHKRWALETWTDEENKLLPGVIGEKFSVRVLKKLTVRLQLEKKARLFCLWSENAVVERWFFESQDCITIG